MCRSSRSLPGGSGRCLSTLKTYGSVSLLKIRENVSCLRIRESCEVLQVPGSSPHAQQCSCSTTHTSWAAALLLCCVTSSMVRWSAARSRGGAGHGANVCSPCLSCLGGCRGRVLSVLPAARPDFWPCIILLAAAGSFRLSRTAAAPAQPSLWPPLL